MRSRDKLELLSLLYNSACVYQTCLFAENLWEAPNLKVTKLTLVAGQIEKIISAHSQDLWPLNLAGFWLQQRCSKHKSLTRDQLLVPFLLLVPSYRRFWMGWQKLLVYFLHFDLRCMRPISDLSTWYAVCFQGMSFRQG